MQVSEDHPDYFRPTSVIHALVYAVGLPTILSELPKVPQKYRGKFGGLLKENNFIQTP